MVTHYKQLGLISVIIKAERERELFYKHSLQLDLYARHLQSETLLKVIFGTGMTCVEILNIVATEKGTHDCSGIRE